MASVAIVGGGAAGFFAAITCAQNVRSGVEILLFERSAHFLSKVRVSGGGRCNVTHACFEIRALASHYPRGERALIAPFHRFQPKDTLEWFERRGVRLKTEEDGRIFPTTDSSQTIIDCLIGEATAAGVQLRANCGVARVGKKREGNFELGLSTGETLVCDRLLIATGGCRTSGPGELAASLEHSLQPPVPSLFTFHIASEWLRGLAGVTVENVEASIFGTKLNETGPLLVTHWGVSGPVILRLSAWGARVLHEQGYKFTLSIKWLAGQTLKSIVAELRAKREAESGHRVLATPIRPIPARLWEQLALVAGLDPQTRWNNLTREAQRRLAETLWKTDFQVIGKSPNKAEFVTCGGIRLKDVNFRTMESRLCPGLYFAGEQLDIDGITGGFNFQAAWTTGWIAGLAMAEAAREEGFSRENG
jgi:predicted Rossmann fold flavoprotein